MPCSRPSGAPASTSSSRGAAERLGAALAVCSVVPTKSAPSAARASLPASPKATTKGGRLARRSPADIAKTLAQIVSLLKTKKGGLRSEEIRKALKLDVREVPRVLKEGLAKKALKSKGQKRATVYTAT